MHTTSNYSSIGLNKIEFKTIHLGHDFDKYYISFLINPLLLQCSPNTLYNEIISITKLKEIPQNLTTILYELSCDLINILQDGKISRADYCGNLWFSDEIIRKSHNIYLPIASQQLAELYMKLLKKGNIPSRFKQPQTLMVNQQIQPNTDNEFTIRCNSYTLSIYLKHSQIIEHNERTGKNIYNASALRDSYGQLRVELRVARNRLYYDKKKLHCNELDLISGENTRIFPTLKNLLNRLYGTGDFFTYDEAKQRIKNLKSGKVQENMLYFLQLVKHCKTLTYEKLHTYDSALTPDFFKRYMKYFNDINISPITLPNRSPIPYFPNPLKYLEGKNTDFLRKNDFIAPLE